MTKKKRSFRENLMARELHKHPFAVPVVTLIVLSFVTMVGFIAFNGRSLGENGEARVVQLSADGEQQSVPTRALTVGDFLKRANINLHEGDVVEPATETEIDAND